MHAPWFQRRGTGRPNPRHAAAKKCLAFLFAGAAALLLTSDLGALTSADTGSADQIRALAEVAAAKSAARKKGKGGIRGSLAARLAEIAQVGIVRGRGGDDPPRKRPAMYTFYHAVKESSVGSEEMRKNMLTAWATAWHRAGWEPVILTLQDVRRHPDYEKYRGFLDTNPWGPYNSMRFWRWFAMATIEGGGWMSDFDVFPLDSFVDRVGKNLPNGGNLTTHDSHIPSLVSGSQSEWDRISKLVTENAEAQKKKDPEEHWSDIHALADMRRRHELRNEDWRFQYAHNVEGGLDFFRAAPFDKEKCEKLRSKLAVHFSHSHVGIAISKGLVGDGRNMEQRPEICKEWVDKFVDKCRTTSVEVTRAVG